MAQLIFESLFTVLEPLITPLKALVTEGFESLGIDLDAIPRAVSTAIEDAYNTIISSMPNSIARLESDLETLYNSLYGAVSGAFPKLNLDLDSIVQGLKDAEQYIIDTIQREIGVDLSALKTYVGDELSGLDAAIKLVRDNLSDKMKVEFDDFGDTLTGIKDDVIGKVSEGTSDLIAGLEVAVGAISDLTSINLSVLIDTLNPIAGALTLLGNFLLGGLKELFTFDISNFMDMQEDFAKREGSRLQKLAASMGS